MIKILLPVDGSQGALAATRTLIQHAAMFKEPVHVELVTVHGVVPIVKGISRTVIEQEEVERHFRTEAENALAPSRRLLEEAGIEHEAHVLIGDTAPALVSHAQNTGCAMIYIGTRGMTPLSGLLLGSVATRVVHLTAFPVVLVK